MYRVVAKETGTVNYLIAGIDRISITKEGVTTVWPSGNGGAPIQTEESISDLVTRYPNLIPENFSDKP